MPDLSWHLLRSLIADEFDMCIAQDLEVDHGVVSPLPMVDFAEGGAGESGSGSGWRFPIVPIAVNVILHPLPTPQRCVKLGEAIARGVASYPEDLRLVVLGTGGLSHQLTGPRFGYIGADWDRHFMKTLAENPGELLNVSYADHIRNGGTESVEVVHWMMMRAALPKDARVFLEAYYPHRIMGYGVQAYRIEDTAA
jgi:hypothetical protein